MSEQDTQRKILMWLAAQGFWTMKAIVSNKKGVPDILACSPSGHFVAIEVKYGANKASKLQQYNVEQIQKIGGFATVCWSLESLINQLKKENII